MLGLKKSDDFQPVAWVGHYPIHMAVLLVLIHIGTMIATAITLSLGQSALLSHLSFSTWAVLNHAALWQFFTYLFINPPSVMFAVEMFLLFSFGRELEKFIGRSAFLALYMALVLIPALMLLVIGWFRPVVVSGSSTVHFAVFIAFATVYPNVDLLFSIKAKWVAWILLGIFSLQALAFHDWTGLFMLWVAVATAWIFIERLRRGLELSPMAFVRRKLTERKIAASPLRVVRKPSAAAPEDAVASIDPILDKIAKQGLSSLTVGEREKLERARKALLEKGV
jgi:membrane associated rhomboid family serine protease